MDFAALAGLSLGAVPDSRQPDEGLDSRGAHSGEMVPIREYIEALLRERERALEVASGERQLAAVALEREREKAAVALREEQHRASDKAERERERAADVLAAGLRNAISEGDEKLRDHIVQEITRITAALKSASELEAERFGSAKAEVASLRREQQLVFEAQKEAVSKAEDAQKEVNLRGNEYRGQLKDQNAMMMPRREAEARFEQLAEQIASNTEKLGKLT